MLSSRVYRPTVAGYLYPADPAALRAAVAERSLTSRPRETAHGLLVPHGTIERCAAVTGCAFERVAIPRRCVILAANHTNAGPAWAVADGGAYSTPLGTVSMDEELSERLRRAAPGLVEVDEVAATREHGVEVVLPWLQVCGPQDVVVTALVVASESSQDCDQVAGALAESVAGVDEPVLLIASSDLTPFQPREVVIERDRQLLEPVRALDPDAWWRAVWQQHAAICGAGAVAAWLGACRRLGASRCEVRAYATSADAGGDPASSVGYAGAVCR